MAAFDTLDGSESFVHPDAMAAVAASGKAAEVEALAAVTEHLGPSLDQLPGNESDHPLFTRLVAAWADEPRSARPEGWPVMWHSSTSRPCRTSSLRWDGPWSTSLAHPVEAAR